MEKNKKIKIICNSSPIIGLAKIERLDIIEKLYREIIVPEAVFDELITKGRDKDKTAAINKMIDKNIVIVQKVKNRELIRALRKDLDYGESEVIALAIELQADLVILDEKDARDIADFYNLTKTGLLGVLIRAKERGFIPSVKEYMDRLIKAGFRIDENLYELIASSLEDGDEERI
jgi:predicted nucleic acid-binding protein